MGRVPAARGTVVVHSLSGREFAERHERATRDGIAERLAALKGFGFAGDYDADARRAAGPVYFVPSDTLVGVEAARTLGIRGEDDLFGGVVPHAFVATKAITHPLVAPDARAPAGWSAEFGRRVRRRRAPRLLRLRARGRAPRRRSACSNAARCASSRCGRPAGAGRRWSPDAAELEAALAAIDAAELAEHGVVLEEGPRRGDDLQRRPGAGGGARRDLLRHAAPDARQRRRARLRRVRAPRRARRLRGAARRSTSPAEARLAVAQARAYDAAATECFPGLFASRRNYDVVQGTDAAGRRRSGVLEQSWRIGGASGAEIAALEAFRAEPALRAVRAVDRGGLRRGARRRRRRARPSTSAASTSGSGPITKYATVEPHGDA